ncbi:hypothetical protein [Chondrinema litorale]|uniref:hypothetical protein n=1 Tax=Chondrinema litorale TaxID=2994555 RepID=UPI0025432F60|nr:hypothetical protein [Chondrinema litorale]UZR97334.1 hypothetical protein OQ292_25875 [Chondrinema litorale]
MSINDQMDRYLKIDQLIRLKSTGSRRELSNKLGLSIRSTQEYINEMKLNGAPIKFCKISNSYIYTANGKFESKFGFTDV